MKIDVHVGKVRTAVRKGNCLQDKLKSRRKWWNKFWKQIWMWRKVVCAEMVP